MVLLPPAHTIFHVVRVDRAGPLPAQEINHAGRGLSRMRESGGARGIGSGGSGHGGLHGGLPGAAGEAAALAADADSFLRSGAAPHPVGLT